MKQYVEGLSGEHARHTKLRLTRRVDQLAAEKFLATDFARSIVAAANPRLQQKCS